MYTLLFFIFFAIMNFWSENS